MEEGKYRLKPKPFNLVDLLMRIEEQLSSLVKKKGLEITFLIQEKPMKTVSEYPVDGEESLFETMLANLIKNAVEASPPGERVTVEAADEELDGGPHHRFSIRNLGAVPASLREHFFEPYVTAGKEGGTGLGTHSARLAARAHHGEIGFTSSEEEGTHVFVYIPQGLAEAPE